MKRLLFITPGNNLVHIGSVLDKVVAAHDVEIQVENILAYQISDGDISLETVSEHAEQADIILFDIRDPSKLAPVLRDVRERFEEKTFVPLMGGSMAVMGLCRMGSFSMDRVADRVPSGSRVNHRKIRQLTSVIEKLGGILPVGALGHGRNWIRAVRYWTAGGERNIENLLHLLLKEYCGGRGPRPSPPIERPTLALELPDEERSYSSVKAYLRDHPFDTSLPTVALLYYSGMHRDASIVGANALIRAFSGRANILPIATDGIQSLDAVERYLLAPNAPPVHLLISLLWFRLNGGPLGGDPQRTQATLDRLDTPYMVPVSLYARELRRWAENPEGLSPVETYATVVLPELDGAMEPTPLFGLINEEVRGVQITRAGALVERAGRIAGRACSWMRLRHLKNSDKRVALIIYDYPPGPGNVGNASYLDVAKSLKNIFARLEEEEYDLGGGSDNPLHDLLESGVHNGNNCGIWHGEYLDTASYSALFADLPESVQRQIADDFGPPPGRTMVDDIGIRIPGRWFGKIFLGCQPYRVPFGDDDTATHDRKRAPHHQYVAFYSYLKESEIDVTVHIGTHGTVEFLPGKELALSDACLPDLLQGDTAGLYLYTIANPSESSIAKRRWHAAIVDHHVPDFVPSDLYGPCQEIQDTLERMKDVGVTDIQHYTMAAEIRESAEKIGLDADDFDRLSHDLMELKHAAIPDGLHVFGESKNGRSSARYLTNLFQRKVAGVHLLAVAKKGTNGADPYAIAAEWAEAFVKTGRLPKSLKDALDSSTAAAVQDALVSLSQRFLVDNELDALVNGLSGRFLPTGLMGDALRSPEVYPTGRNGCSFDATRIPFEDAIERGHLLGEGLVQKHVKAHGMRPFTVGLVLWGFETARTGGETIGQLLYLIGGRLKKTKGWLPAFEPIPISRLGRPRVDVYLMICGFFRDMFPMLVRDLDELMRAIGALDEPLDMNPIRAHMRGGRETSGATTSDLTESRIFGPRPGEYGTGLPDYVDQSNWDEAADLGKIYEEAMGYAYGARCHGSPAQSALGALFSRTDAVCQVIDGEEYKIGDLDHYYEFLGGATRAVENRRGKGPLSMVGDTARNSPRISDAKTEIARFAVTRLLNPKWIDGMLAHEIHGGKKIEERVTNLVGLAGTVGVPSELFDQVFERFVDDAALFERLCQNNCHAAVDLLRRMKEADERGMWDADETQIDTLKERYLELDAELE